MTYIKTKYYKFESFKNAEYKKDKFASTQLMKMYRVASNIKNPQILELGTHKGASATIFLQACKVAKGKLVSVDIHNHAYVSNSNRWRFVQSNSTNLDYILSKVPELKNGIDILYIDSLHTKKHVEKELNTWYPLLNEKSHIFFDDIDANPYRKGNRKDHIYKEINYREIREFVEAFFYTNEESLYLDAMFGSTGLAHIYKLSPKGSKPRKAKAIQHRKKGVAFYYFDFKKSLRGLFSKFKQRAIMRFLRVSLTYKDDTLI